MATEFRALEARQTDSKSFRSRHSHAHKRNSKGSAGRLRYCADMLVGKSRAWCLGIESVIEVEEHRSFQTALGRHHSPEENHPKCWSASKLRLCFVFKLFHLPTSDQTGPILLVLSNNQRVRFEILSKRKETNSLEEREGEITRSKPGKRKVKRTFI